MRFINMTNNESLTEAAIVAEKLLSSDSRMMNELREKSDWRYNSGDSYNVTNSLLNYPFTIKILTYRPWNRFTRAIAMTNGDGAIHFNIYKIDKTDLASKVGTILHEYSHLCGFKHGNNYKTKEKCEKSVPYFLSSNVEKWL